MKTIITKMSMICLIVLMMASCKKDPEMPGGEFVNIKTNEITEITGFSAVVSAYVGAGCDVRGVCWSVSPNPTVSDSHTTDGGGTGSFTSSITGLTKNTTYYVRAYATNGKGTSYGEQKSFTTLQTFTVNGVSFEMIAVEGGTFTMGATSEQGSDAYDDEKPTHSVTLSDYYIGKFEVTQELWEAVMGSNPSFFNGSNLPVEQVSWNDCQEFITKLNGLTGKNFRLPTEAEWEYAARGGNRSGGYKYSGSNNINDVAWYDNNSGSTHAVGTKSPNELGIYDMSGNVYEWCQDWYGSYSSGSQTNPQGPSSGSYRVLRGGCWHHNALICRVSSRSLITPDHGDSRLGLRLAL
ncbi:MAG: formylglycine-generating enzyme family protein [Bacteroidia bacterium]|nr:formylglycine-generating enzyme family protein [Bacteroidia bacterium]